MRLLECPFEREPGLETARSSRVPGRSRPGRRGPQRRSRHAACALARTCSALVAPALTEVTGDCCSSRENAACTSVMPRSVQKLWKASSWSPVGGVEHVLLGVGQARTGGNVVAAVLAGQQAVSEREVRQHTHAEVPCGGQDFEFCAAVEQVVVVFCGDEPFGAGSQAQCSA